MKKIPWRILETEISGALVGREFAYPSMRLKMHPVGTQLPLEEQTRRLEVTIDRTTTNLDEEGIQTLKEFLEMRP